MLFANDIIFITLNHKFAEFSLALEYMKMPVSDGMLERLFAKYDADGSGSIEYAEFRTAWLGLADPKKELEARNIGESNNLTQL